MAVIQYSIPTSVYRDAIDRAARLGISEHQLLKYIALAAYNAVSDEEVQAVMRKMARERAAGKVKEKRGVL